MKLTSSASFSPSIRISLCLKTHQAQAKNFCRVLDIRVAQIMESNAGQPRPLEQRLHVTISCIGIDWIFRLHGVRKYPLTDGIRFSPPQDFSHAVRQDDGAHALIGLRLAGGILALPLAVESAAYL